MAKAILALLPRHGVVYGAMPDARAGVREFRNILKRSGLIETVESVEAVEVQICRASKSLGALRASTHRWPILLASSGRDAAEKNPLSVKFYSYKWGP